MRESQRRKKRVSEKTEGERYAPLDILLLYNKPNN